MSLQQINTPLNGVSEKLLLEQLSSAISGSAGIVSGYLATNHLPQPSFEANRPSVIVPVNAPPNVQLARQKLLAASLELFQLATGPSDFLPNLATGFQYLSCLTWLCQYKILHLIPLNASISYDAPTASEVSVQRLKAVVRMSMTTGLFREDVAGGSVVHSATSALLARDPVVYSYATRMCGGSAPVAQEMAAAALKWGPDSTQPYETAFNVTFDTDLPFFDHLSRNPDKMAEFSAYMRNARSSDTMALRHLTASFAWEGIREDGVVVDIGGSTGDAAIALVEAFPHLKLVVQDLPANVDNLVDAMKNRPSSKLLIMDTVLPKPGSVPVSIERLVRVRDMTKIQSFNSKERDLDDWKALLADVDAGLHLVNVVQPFGSALSVLEVTLDK
ncbi:S-adenosyl-L-methionine-dependent methyltransferase [Phaeosphaeriaceae sp. PMI808]|nr:S-adenosyl-L-methionine-dependent methyltransferase [Phaeosphaeriaceae sp. PMI808]